MGRAQEVEARDFSTTQEGDHPKDVENHCSSDSIKSTDSSFGSLTEVWELLTDWCSQALQVLYDFYGNDPLKAFSGRLQSGSGTGLIFPSSVTRHGVHLSHRTGL